MAKSKLVHFMRHGQYVTDGGDGPLTALGRRQARRTAKRLRDGGVTRMYSSDLCRASETTAIIAERLDLSVTTLSMLREVLPTSVPSRSVSLSTRRLGKDRVEETIERFLTRPPRSGDIVVVCHGNLIRALVCRVLGTPATRWTQLGIFHCGITTFKFRKSGQLELETFNDSGHLASDLRTSV